MLPFDDEAFTYRLSAARIDEPQPVLLMEIAASVREHLPALSEQTPIVDWYLEEYPEWFWRFCGKLASGSRFGFVSDLIDDYTFAVTESARDGAIVVEIPIPQFQRLGRSCWCCGGSGKDVSWPEDMCRLCSGLKRQTTYDHHPLFVTVASISLLLTILRASRDPSKPFAPCGPRQLLKVETFAQLGPHGGSLHGAYSRELADWLRFLLKKHNCPEDGYLHLPEVEAGMRRVYEHMHPIHQSAESRDIRARIGHDGWLTIQDAGDRCSIYPDDTLRAGQGYRFACHNVDRSDQQLRILVGLATLSDLALADGVGQ
jgi:hypothetical protein